MFIQISQTACYQQGAGTERGVLPLTWIIGALTNVFFSYQEVWQYCIVRNLLKGKFLWFSRISHVPRKFTRKSLPHAHNELPYSREQTLLLYSSRSRIVAMQITALNKQQPVLNSHCVYFEPYVHLDTLISLLSRPQIYGHLGLLGTFHMAVATS